MSGGVLSGQSGGGGISDGDKGDVTVSASGETWTVDDDVITLAKMANIASASLLGRVTAGSGSPEALTGTQVTALLDTVTVSAKGLVPTAPNDVTKYLDGTGAWSVPPNNTLTTSNVIPKGNGTTQVASLLTDDGTVVTNTGNTDLTAGTTTVGTLSVTGNSTLNGDVVLGDTSADTMTVNATPTFVAPATFADNIILGATSTINDSVGTGTSGQVLAVNGSGYPRWTTLTDADNALTTANAIPVGNGTTQVASSITDDGTTVTFAGDTDLTAGTTTVGRVDGKVQTVSTTGTIHDLTLDDDTAILKFDGNGQVVLCGLTGGYDGRIVYLLNANTTSITPRVALGHEISGSTAENRFINGTNISSMYIDQGALGAIIYDGGASRWRSLSQREFYQIVVQSSVTVNGNTVTNGLTSTNGTIYANMNAGSPATSAIEARSNGSVGGFVSLVPLGTDNVHLAFDASYASSAWTAQDTSWASIAKSGDKLNIFGSSGATDGSAIADYTTKLAAPNISIDLLDGTVYIDVLEAASAYITDTKLNGSLDVGPMTGSVSGGAILIGRRIYKTSDTYSPTTGTYKVLVQMVGSGGGGAGANADHPAGGGGGSGFYWEKWIDPGAAVTGGTVTIGAGGAGGDSGSSYSGQDGSVTSVVINGTTYSTAGGEGALRDNDGKGGYLTTGTITSGYDVGYFGGGGHGGSGVLGNYIGGPGGTTQLGTGGIGGHVNGDSGGVGGSSIGYGAGGGGGIYASVEHNGGDGSDGVVIIWEYR